MASSANCGPDNAGSRRLLLVGCERRGAMVNRGDKPVRAAFFLPLSPSSSRWCCPSRTRAKPSGRRSERHRNHARSRVTSGTCRRWNQRAALSSTCASAHRHRRLTRHYNRYELESYPHRHRAARPGLRACRSIAYPTAALGSCRRARSVRGLAQSFSTTLDKRTAGTGIMLRVACLRARTFFKIVDSLAALQRLEHTSRCLIRCSTAYVLTRWLTIGSICHPGRVAVESFATRHVRRLHREIERQRSQNGRTS